MRTSHLNASFENRLNAVEDLFADERLKVTTPGHAKFRNVNQAGVQPIRQHAAEALRIECPAATCAKAETRHRIENFFLRESSCREFFKRSLHEGATFRVGDQPLA